MPCRDTQTFHDADLSTTRIVNPRGATLDVENQIQRGSFQHDPFLSKLEFATRLTLDSIPASNAYQVVRIRQVVRATRHSCRSHVNAFSPHGREAYIGIPHTFIPYTVSSRPQSGRTASATASVNKLPIGSRNDLASSVHNQLSHESIIYSSTSGIVRLPSQVGGLRDGSLSRSNTSSKPRRRTAS